MDRNPKLETQIDAMLGEVAPPGTASAVAAELAADEQLPRPAEPTSPPPRPTLDEAPTTERPGARPWHAVIGVQCTAVAAVLIVYAVMGGSAALLVGGLLLVTDVLLTAILLKGAAEGRP